MPKTVRLGVTLIGVALALDVMEIFGAKGWTLNSLTQVIVLVLLFGGLLFGIARRRNWARLLFALLFVAALPFSLVAMSRAPLSRTLVLSMCLAALQAAGLLLLFLPTSSAWYHGRDRAA